MHLLLEIKEKTTGAHIGLCQASLWSRRYDNWIKRQEHGINQSFKTKKKIFNFLWCMEYLIINMDLCVCRWSCNRWITWICHGGKSVKLSDFSFLLKSYEEEMEKECGLVHLDWKLAKSLRMRKHIKNSLIRQLLI